MLCSDVAYHRLPCYIPTTANHLREMQWGRLEYFVPAENLTWASVFGTLERCRQHLPIEDYSVTQTTLERVSLKSLGPLGGKIRVVKLFTVIQYMKQTHVVHFFVLYYIISLCDHICFKENELFLLSLLSPSMTCSLTSAGVPHLHSRTAARGRGQEIAASMGVSCQERAQLLYVDATLYH